MFIKYITDDHYRSLGWELQYSGLVSSEEFINLSDLIIFPNPANEKLYFTGLSNNTQIRISDLSGKVIRFESDGIIETNKFVKR